METEALSQSHAIKADFKYKHANPYHDKLNEFSDFVLRDLEAEEFKGQWNSKVFQNENPLHVEIGSGYGHFIREFCSKNKDINFIGIDYRFKRTFNLVRKINNLGLKNIRFLRAKGERIAFMFAKEEVDHLYMFFPDPWPKAKHQKKRTFQKPLLDAAYETLKPQGKFSIKTDHDDYAMWMLCEIEKDPRFKLEMSTRDLYHDYPGHELAQFQTKFEKIFLSQGQSINAFVLRKI